jgi:hypothetical protein
MTEIPTTIAAQMAVVEQALRDLAAAAQRANAAAAGLLALVEIEKVKQQ